MAAGELGRRLAVAGVGIPVAVLLIGLGGWPLGLVLAAAAAATALELFRLAGHSGVRAFEPAGAAAAAGLVLLATATRDAGLMAQWAWPASLGLALLLPGLAVWSRGPNGRPLAAAAITLLGALVIGGGLAHAPLLRHLGDPSVWTGSVLLAFPIALTWVGDSCAYFAGRAWGRTKLIPRVSPGKTVVGAVANAAGTVLLGAGYAWLVLRPAGLPVGPGTGAAIGAAVTVAGQVGDLAESLIKREAGVKDSGGLLPGHGGLLDRADSLLYTIPVTYWAFEAAFAVWGGG